MSTEGAIFQVGHLERLPLGTTYPAIVHHVGRLVARLPQGTELVIDYTGVGRPVFDLFRYSGIFPTGMLITSGVTEAMASQSSARLGLPKVGWAKAYLSSCALMASFSRWWL